MNDHDPFEEQLRWQRWRAIPPSWREEILSAAIRSAPARERVVPRATPGTYWLELLQRLIWPHPRAWAALGAAWILIVVLNLSGGEARSSATIATATPLAVSPEARQLLREQQRLLADLSGLGQDSLESRPAHLPRPGTENRNGIVNTNA